MLEPIIQTCQLHEQPMNVYCFDCKTLICLYCSIKTHNNHNHESVKVAVSDTKKKLDAGLKRLSDTKQTLSQAVSTIQDEKMKISTQGESETKKIERSFAELNEIIEDRKKELLAESKTGMNKKLNRLAKQEKSLSTRCAVVQGVIEYTKQCIEHSSDNEVMCKQAELMGRIDKELEVGDLEPVEEVDTEVQVNCAEGLKKLCQTGATVKKLTFTCTPKPVVNNKVMINKTVVREVSVKFSNGQLPTKKMKVECVSHDPKGHKNDCTIQEVEAGEYSIEYRPRVAGNHTLTVTANGQNTSGGSLYINAYKIQHYYDDL